MQGWASTPSFGEHGGKVAPLQFSICTLRDSLAGAEKNQNQKNENRWGPVKPTNRGDKNGVLQYTREGLTLTR